MNTEATDEITEKVGGRLSDGSLPSFSSFGAYPIIYVTKNGDVLCAKCATDQIDNEDNATNDDPIVAVDVFYEGPDHECDNCYGAIPSAYGNPWADTDGTEE